MEELVTMRFATMTKRFATMTIKLKTTMKHFLLHIFLLLLVFGVVGCTGDISDVPADSGAEALGAHRDSVALTFEASLAAPAARAEFDYGDLGGGKKGLALSWSERDVLGVYIRTEKGTIIRAGSISGTGTAGDKSRNFSGIVLQKFEGEDYIYMHPDLGNSTVLSFEEQYGCIGDGSPLDANLPIIWKSSKTGGTTPPQGTCKGYVIRLVLNFTEDPGDIRKIILHTDKTSATANRIFPRSYGIDHLLLDDPFGFTEPIAGTATSSATYTDAISLNVTGNARPHKNAENNYTVEAYIASASVKNLNVFNTKLRVEVINHDGKTYATNPVSFKGQTEAQNQTLLAQDVFPDGTLRKMEQQMSRGGVTPTIINYQYGIGSILGMWNEYGQSYDPNGLIKLKDGTGGKNSDMPDVLVTNGVGLAIHDRYTLTPSGVTPQFTWELYKSQSQGTDHKQADVTCNNIDIVEIPDAPEADQGTEIYVSFLSEYAWNQNLLGYYHYPTPNKDANPAITVPASAMDVMKNIIFPNLSKPGHEPFNTNGLPKNNIGKDEDAPMREYMTVKLIYTDPVTGASSTKFPSGTTIGFWGMIDAKANGFQQSQFSLLNWNQWRFFSNSKWNAENSNWKGNYTCCNFFASGDICKTTNPNATIVASSEVIPGIAIYGFMDDVNKGGREATAFSTCIFLVSASNTAAMKTYNKACFNIGCDKDNGYPANIVIKK